MITFCRIYLIGGDFIYYLKKYIWIVFIVFILLLFVFTKDKSTEEVILEKNDNLEIKEEIITDNVKLKIKVDIKGAVKNPGVYEVEENSRVSDVINISGGLTNEADTSIINLSKNVEDEMVIIIYTKAEINEMKKGNTSVKYVEKECVCPKIENDACIENKVDNIPSNNSNLSNNKISLNKASLDELMTLDGIGEKKAQAIIDYRNKNNGFKKVEEILEVDGIGSATYEKIKDRLIL